MEEARLGGESRDPAMPLVGDTGASLSAGKIGILHRSGLTGNQGVLSVVDGMGIGVGQAQVNSASHAAIHGERGPVVETGGRALEFVNGSELGDGPSQGIDAGWKGTVECVAELPGRKRRDGVVTTGED